MAVRDRRSSCAGCSVPDRNRMTAPCRQRNARRLARRRGLCLRVAQLREFSLPGPPATTGAMAQELLGKGGVIGKIVLVGRYLSRHPPPPNRKERASSKNDGHPVTPECQATGVAPSPAMRRARTRSGRPCRSPVDCRFAPTIPHTVKPYPPPRGSLRNCRLRSSRSLRTGSKLRCVCYQ